jgi:hypothetical protein
MMVVGLVAPQRSLNKMHANNYEGDSKALALLNQEMAAVREGKFVAAMSSP